MRHFERLGSIPVPYLDVRYGTLQALRSKEVPYLPYLPYLIPRPRAPARTRTRVYLRVHAAVKQVWKVWKVWKSKAQQWFQGSIPRAVGVEGMEPFRK